MAQGDVDGDGTEDALVGAPFAGMGSSGTTPPGEAYVVSGPTTGRDRSRSTADVVIHGTDGWLPGESRSPPETSTRTAGRSCFVGSPYEGRRRRCAAYVFYGAMPGHVGRWGRRRRSSWAWAAPGRRDVALAVADLDANGRADLLIGAPVESSKSVQWCGALYVVMSD